MHVQPFTRMRGREGIPAKEAQASSRKASCTALCKRRTSRHHVALHVVLGDDRPQCGIRYRAAHLPGQKNTATTHGGFPSGRTSICPPWAKTIRTESKKPERGRHVERQRKAKEVMDCVGGGDTQRASTPICTQRPRPSWTTATIHSLVWMIVLAAIGPVRPDGRRVASRLDHTREELDPTSRPRPGTATPAQHAVRRRTAWASLHGPAAGAGADACNCFASSAVSPARGVGERGAICPASPPRRRGSGTGAREEGPGRKPSSALCFPATHSIAAASPRETRARTAPRRGARRHRRRGPRPLPTLKAAAWGPRQRGSPAQAWTE